MTTRKPTIFIVHPSDLLTDHRLYGDGLIACGFLRELANRGYRLHVACQEVDLKEPMPGNVTFHPIRQSWPGPLKRLEYMVRTRLLLEKLRKEETIDLVHQMNPVFVGLSLGMVGCGLPVLLGTYVARWPDQNRDSLKVRLESGVRWAICFLQQWQATSLMLTTPAAMDRIAVPGMVKGKIVTMHHGIDADLFSPSGALPEKGPLSILFYTSVARRKGIFDLLKAFEIVAREMPEATLSIIGRGDHWEEVNALIATLPCRDRIHTKGHVPRDSSVEFFRQHAIYVLPSHGEPLGTTAIEGMACGKPLVVTDTGGLPYLLPPDGSGGFIVPQENPEAMAEALLKLLRSPEMQQRMGAANRSYVEKHYAWTKVVDRLEEVYAGLVTERHSGAPLPLAS